MISLIAVAASSLGINEYYRFPTQEKRNIALHQLAIPHRLDLTRREHRQITPDSYGQQNELTHTSKIDNKIGLTHTSKRDKPGWYQLQLYEV